MRGTSFQAILSRSAAPPEGARKQKRETRRPWGLFSDKPLSGHRRTFVSGLVLEGVLTLGDGGRRRSEAGARADEDALVGLDKAAADGGEHGCSGWLVWLCVCGCVNG